MHEIQADMRLSEQDDVYAYGQVMIDRCIKFPVQMRRYIDNESGEEKAFLSYPRKEYKGEWKDVVSPDQELRAKINQAVGEAIKKEISKDLNTPKVEVLLGDMTIDKRTDGTSTGHFGNASLNNDKMGRTLMTPAEIRRMPRKDCIIFLEGQYPIYDWKNLPFGTKEWKESEQLAGKEGYKNPVRVVFNKETMTYRTITSKSAIQFLDKKDVEFYKAAEKTDDTIKVFEMSEEEFLYLNWRKEPPLSEDEVAKIFEQAKMEKINPNEKVPEDVEGLSEQKKSQIGERKDHDLSGSITECIKRYIKELNQEQIDQILTGLEEGLTEKQVKTYFFLPVEKQSQYRRAYLFANKK